MAKQPPSDDLFEDTKMSFGSHIEELRVSLSRALLGLLAGFLIGLLIAHYVVKFIETPLTTALEDYYLETDMIELQEKYDGKLPPEFAEFMVDERLVSDEIFIEFAELGHLAKEFESRDSSVKDPVATLPENESSDERSEGQAGAIIETEALPDVNGMIKTRIWKPLETKVQALGAQEAFMIWLKAGFITGLLLASPYMFHEIWKFVAAGLYPHEKKYVAIYVPFSLALFLAGASTAFFFVFKPVLGFLFSFNRMMDIDPDPRISEWISFVLFLPLGFGIAFQLPLVMLFLNRITIFSVEAYLEKWRIAILVIFVISMLLTPADPISMLLMAVPLTVLYFLGIALCKWMPRGRNPFADAYDP